jgi:hypothetical protein
VVPAVVAPANDLITKNTILNLSKLSIPLLDPTTKIRMLLNCPQIRRSPIELAFDENLDSYLDFSRYIVSKLGLDPHLKAVLYNRKGQPYFYNLDLMHMRLPKLDFSE